MIEVKAKINNVNEIYARYVVARLVNGEFWFYGAWDDGRKAEEVASGFREENGVVFDTQEGEA